MLGDEYNWIITSELANQQAPKALFTCVVYSKIKYSRFCKVMCHYSLDYFELLLFFCLFFCLLVFFGADSSKIEKVNSNSKASTPKYKILREPPQGRPEFFVIEIVLPGIVSMQR